jgi:hypothetical protein
LCAKAGGATGAVDKMRLILTLIYAGLLAAAAALPAAASVHAAMYCWVPDFEIAVACDEDDEGNDGDDTVRQPGRTNRITPPALVIEADR